MNKLMFAFAATMALASFGCKKKGGAGGSGEAMAKMTEFKDKMCACKDADCAKKVSDEMTKWSQESASKSKEPVKMSEADQKKATEIGTAMGECMQKAMMPAAGSDAAGSAAAGSAAAGSAAGSAAALTINIPENTPKECKEYAALLNKVLVCDKVDATLRSNLQHTTQVLIDQLTSPGLTAEGIKGGTDHCKNSIEGTKKEYQADCKLD